MKKKELKDLLGKMQTIRFALDYMEELSDVHSFAKKKDGVLSLYPIFFLKEEVESICENLKEKVQELEEEDTEN